jgi:hypothetical protein
MLQAYIGIVSHRGLEAFWPESPHTVRFISHRAKRIHRGAACFWTVIPVNAAVHIQEALNGGQTEAALEVIRDTAREIGGLLPFDDEAVTQ